MAVLSVADREFASETCEVRGCGPQILESSSRGVWHEVVLVVKPAQKRPRDHTKTVRKRVRSAL